MKMFFTILLCFLFGFLSLPAQENFAVKGLCIAAPAPDEVDDFVTLIDKELAPAGVNTLILRIDFNYRFTSRPELTGDHPLEKSDVKKLVDICRKDSIRLIPQINLLGHQSWSTRVGKLLEVYPHFDETPDIQMPAEYKWPNPDGLYCKSYCPLHPDVHRVVFDLVDEIMDAFGANAFHAGMDEVFYIGHKSCPRCSGMDPSALFAGEVTKISNHLALSGRELWIWGDRLIDGKATGIGEWEASYNNTHRAIDMIPKEVVICDWHYEKAHPTPVLFAAKGFRVVACPWRKKEVASAQVSMLKGLKENSSGVMKPRYAGMFHTYWGAARQFMKGMRDGSATTDPSVECFRELVKIW